MAPMWPLPSLKLKVWIAAEPWLPTRTSPSDEESYVVPQATSTPIATRATTPSSHANLVDILCLISMFRRGLREHTTPVARAAGSLLCGKRGKFSTHLSIRNAQEEQTPTKTYWNLGSAAELPDSSAVLSIREDR